MAIACYIVKHSYVLENSFNSSQKKSRLPDFLLLKTLDQLINTIEEPEVHTYICVYAM